jgi:uncharacterized membrane protein YeaQ/YmgE (transglycosylase-associated protein family)
MHIIWMIIVGFIIGVLAKFIHPGRDKMGLMATALLGIGGSIVASYGGQALGLYQPGEPAGFVGAVIGAIILLFVYGRLRASAA